MWLRLTVSQAHLEDRAEFISLLRARRHVEEDRIGAALEHGVLGRDIAWC